MPLTAGTRLGQYEIIASVGAGGMGEVYRARDTKLNRDVALKILPDNFSSDPDRRARFEREAQALAALNHPNIAQIYDAGRLPDQEQKTPGVMAIVMELVEGHTLEEMIAASGRGIPLADALPIAQQMAEALEAAHEQGIIHRDLKPANVKVTPEGRVKVLDFGLAKALGPDSASGAEEGPSLATMTSPAMTAMGMIVGTAAYMSPEQARGRPADKRADIWAFGVVLFEMLSGKRMFSGETVSDVLAHVLTKEPVWDDLPNDTPSAIRKLLRRCLTKDRKNRLRDVGEARIGLEEYLDDPADASVLMSSVAVAPADARPGWQRALPTVALVVAACAMTAAVVWVLRPTPAPAGVTRFSVALADDTNPMRTRVNLAVSPDGSQLAFVAFQQIFLRPMREAEVRAVPRLRGAFSNLVFSPDGGSIAYFDDGDDTLKRIETTGGAPVTICQTPTPAGGVTWSGQWLFWAAPGGIRRVQATGGEPELVVPLEPGEMAFRPQLLPDGRTLLFAYSAGGDEGSGDTGRWMTASIVAQRLDTAERTTIVESGTDARYLSTGHIVYAVGGVVFARPFDADALEVRGGAASVIEGVGRPAGDQSGGGAHFAVSDTGTLVYLAGPVEGADGDVLQLAFVDREGKVEPLDVPAGRYATPRLSPDGRSVAFTSVDDQGESIWVYDTVNGGAARRLTFDGNARIPVWSADSQRVTYQSDREGDLGIFWQRADGTDRPERLTRPEGKLSHIPNSWSRDGAFLLFDETDGTKTSLMVLTAADGTIEPFGVSSSRPTTAQFSPDGRWIAYATSEDQLQAVFVQPFPATGARFQVSSSAEDGHHQVWSPDGTEIFFTPGPGPVITGVRVTTSQGFALGRETGLPRPFTNAAPWVQTTYDISRDGRKFLGLVGNAGGGSAPAGQLEIKVVLNWFQELGQRVPVR